MPYVNETEDEMLKFLEKCGVRAMLWLLFGFTASACAIIGALGYAAFRIFHG